MIYANNLHYGPLAQININSASYASYFRLFRCFLLTNCNWCTCFKFLPNKMLPLTFIEVVLLLLTITIFKFVWWIHNLFLLVCLMVFNATFNNISVISWRSVLLVEEIGVAEENHRPVASHWQTLPHNVVSSTPRHERGVMIVKINNE